MANRCFGVMTLHVSKGLEFPVVALVGAGRMPAEGEDEREEARLFYVGATRATQRLVIGARGVGSSLPGYRQKVRPNPDVLLFDPFGCAVMSSTTPENQCYWTSCCQDLDPRGMR